MEFGFYLKKIVSIWVMPLGVITLLLGLHCLLFKRYAKVSRILSLLAFMLLFLLSTSNVANFIVGPLEQRYAVNQEPIEGPCNVHVLGSGHNEAIQSPAVQKLSRIARSRLLEGLRQIQLAKDSSQCTLIVSGGTSRNHKYSEAQVMAMAARELGFYGRILKLDQARDTLEEAKSLHEKQLKKIRLVTSALHMPRSVQIFQAQGIEVSPAPTDFLSSSVGSWRISSRNLLHITEAWHEYIGLLWLWIT